MTAPRITFEPYYEGAELCHACLGDVRVGIVHGNRWLCHLSPRFLTNGGWKDAKSPQAAKNALIAAVREWCRMAGLTEPEIPT